ncbi:glutamate-cysteine ligase chloroplastic-like, partial [Trifolium medium]|nr:glutamate-cysteine ligase chloroplastic-like [Trifolium medium]
DFMAGKLPAIRGQVPTISDWENHLTTIFPEFVDYALDVPMHIIETPTQIRTLDNSQNRSC